MSKRRRLPKIRTHAERERDEAREKLAFTALVGGGGFALGAIFAGLFLHRIG